MARRHTRWRLKVRFVGNTVSVGHAYNVRPQCDTVRMRWPSHFDVVLRPDEAVILAAGLNLVAGEQMHNTKGRQQKGARKAARSRRRSHGRG